MLTKVSVKICSEVTLDGDPTPERTEEVAAGYIKQSELDGSLLLSYKTEVEGARITTEIYPTSSALRLVRRGAIESEIVFEKGKLHKSLYKIPPYSFDLSVKTDSLSSTLSAIGGEIMLVYSMTVGGARKQCKMHIKAEKAS